MVIYILFYYRQYIGKINPMKLWPCIVYVYDVQASFKLLKLDSLIKLMSYKLSRYSPFM
jgi:hypothetical protein